MQGLSRRIYARPTRNVRARAAWMAAHCGPIGTYALALNLPRHRSSEEHADGWCGALMENRTGYTVPLALEDFVPVVLGVAGGSLLVRAAASRVPSPADVESRDHRPGAGCCWGGSKALWRPIVEAEGSDVRLLEQVLFPLRGQAEQTLALHSTLQSINTVGRAA